MQMHLLSEELNNLMTMFILITHCLPWRLKNFFFFLNIKSTYFVTDLFAIILYLLCRITKKKLKLVTCHLTSYKIIVLIML